MSTQVTAPPVRPSTHEHSPSTAADRTAAGGLSCVVRVTRHELVALRTDGTFRWLAILLAVLFGYAIYNGASWVRFKDQAAARVVSEETARLGALRDQAARIEAGFEPPPPAFRDPRRPAAVGGPRGQRHAVLPTAPLAAFSVGQSDLHPTYVPVSTRSREVVLSVEEIENPLHLMAGRFDLAMVIVYLLPLLILALSYNLLSHEKESGTLALLLSQPVRLGHVVAGKVLARFAVLIAVAVVFAGAGALLAGSPVWSGGALSAFLLWSMVVVVYAGCWFAIALAVNALGRPSAANAVALASIWLALVLLIPSVLNAVATTMYPVPSRAEMIGATREASRQATAQGSAVLARYYEDHPKLLPEGEVNLQDFAVRTYAVQEATDAHMQPVRDRFQQQIDNQRAMVGRFAFLSPAILLQEALNDISGTGDARYRHFIAQVDRFHAEWRGFFGPRIYRHALLASGEYAQLPAWRFEEETARAGASRVAAAIGGMLALTLVAVVLGLRWLGRYPVAG